MSEKKERTAGGRRLVEIIVTAAREKLAEHLTVIDCHGTAAASDFFIIAQSETTVQNIAIADSIVDLCVRHNTPPWHAEGKHEGRWILLDFSDVVVHIMLPELRTYYDLETLWTRGNRTDVTGS